MLLVKPTSGGLFGGGNTTNATPAPSGSTLFGNFGQTSGNVSTSAAQTTASTPAATSMTPPSAFGLFGAKTPGQASATMTPGTSTAGATPTPG